LSSIRDVPKGGTDCHAQILDDGSEFSAEEHERREEAKYFREKNGEELEIPGSDGVDMASYRAMRTALGLERSVLVQAADDGTEHGGIIRAIEDLRRTNDKTEPQSAVGIGELEANVGDRELEDLSEAGLCGAIFRMYEGEEAYEWAVADRLAWRLHDFGWHVELEINGSDLHQVEQRLGNWPGWIVLPRFGAFTRTRTLNQRGFKALTRLIDRDKIWVKFSAPYEISLEGKVDDPEVAKLASALADWAPERMIWGSNWPHQNAPRGRPDDRKLLELLSDWVPEDRRRKMILCENPAELYRLGKD